MSDEAFWSRVAQQGECWVWTGPRSSKGYATINRNGTSKGVHRHAYELMVGEIPAGLSLDHLCRVKHCVNPDHLDPVPLSENTRRARMLNSDRCKRGHLFDEANTRLKPSNGTRQCRTCNRERMRKKGKGLWTWSKLAD